MSSPSPRPERAPITLGLLADITAVLEKHGYRQGDARAVGASIALLGDLVDGYEGRIDSLRQPRTYVAEAAQEVPGE